MSQPCGPHVFGKVSDAQSSIVSRMCPSNAASSLTSDMKRHSTCPLCGGEEQCHECWLLPRTGAARDSNESWGGSCVFHSHCEGARAILQCSNGRAVLSKCTATVSLRNVLCVQACIMPSLAQPCELKPHSCGTGCSTRVL
jgi:hypothetical protein